MNYFACLPVGLDFASESGLPVGLDMKTPWPDSVLYLVIYTQPWHKFSNYLVSLASNVGKCDANCVMWSDNTS